MSPRQALARTSAPDVRQDERSDGETKLADAVHAAIERFGPAADVVAGFGDRLDKLCKWLGSWKPWATLALFLLLGRTINAAPENVPALLSSIAEIVKAFR